MISDEDKAKLRRLMEARIKRDEAKQALTLAEDDFREIEAEVYERLQGVEGTIKVPLGAPWGTVSFRNRETHYGRIIDDEAALEYFEKRAMLDEITTAKFAKARINEIVREALEGDGEMPPGIDYYADRGVTITRPKGAA